MPQTFEGFVNEICVTCVDPAASPVAAVTHASTVGGTIRYVPSNAWTETGITWAHMPGLGTAKVLATRGAVAINTTQYISLAIANLPKTGVITVEIDSTNSVYAGYMSRQNTIKPELIYYSS